MNYELDSLFAMRLSRIENRVSSIGFYSLSRIENRVSSIGFYSLSGIGNRVSSISLLSVWVSRMSPKNCWWLDDEWRL